MNCTVSTEKNGKAFSRGVFVEKASTIDNIIFCMVTCHLKKTSSPAVNVCRTSACLFSYEVVPKRKDTRDTAMPKGSFCLQSSHGFDGITTWLAPNKASVEGVVLAPPFFSSLRFVLSMNESSTEGWTAMMERNRFTTNPKLLNHCARPKQMAHQNEQPGLDLLRIWWA